MQAELDHKHGHRHCHHVDDSDYHWFPSFVIWIKVLVDILSGNETADTSPGKVDATNDEETDDVGVQRL